MKCCLCGGEIRPVGDWTEGNNAEPAAEGRCCDECNSMIVIPMRLAEMMRRRNERCHST